MACIHSIGFLLMSLQCLLRDREEDINMDKVFDKKPSYYFVDPLFMPLAKKVNWKHETNAVKNFYLQWVTTTVGPPINKVDYILVPTCVHDNHWVLMVFVVKAWAVMIIEGGRESK